jgi:hypothetical protein
MEDVLSLRRVLATLATLLILYITTGLFGTNMDVTIGVIIGGTVAMPFAVHMSRWSELIAPILVLGGLFATLTGPQFPLFWAAFAGSYATSAIIGYRIKVFLDRPRGQAIRQN